MTFVYSIDASLLNMHDKGAINNQGTVSLYSEGLLHCRQAGAGTGLPKSPSQIERKLIKPHHANHVCDLTETATSYKMNQQQYT
jgi:hypothetical protein